jgi:hypothetical protein
VPGKEYWFGFAIYLDENYVAPELSDIMWQVHARPDLHIGEGYRNPPLGFSVSGLNKNSGVPTWQISTKGDSKKFSGASGSKKSYTSSSVTQIGPIADDIGRWVKFVIHYKHSYNNDGFIKVYKDSKHNLLVNKQNVGTAFNDDRGGYMKMGSYKWSWRDTSNYKTIIPARRQSYVDSLRVAIGQKGQNRYDDVAP